MNRTGLRALPGPAHGIPGKLIEASVVHAVGFCIALDASETGHRSHHRSHGSCQTSYSNKVDPSRLRLDMQLLPSIACPGCVSMKLDSRCPQQTARQPQSVLKCADRVSQIAFQTACKSSDTDQQKPLRFMCTQLAGAPFGAKK